MYDDMRELVGKKVLEIKVSPDDTGVVFETSNGPIAYETEGECCSSTWVDSINNPEFLLGETVLAVESIGMSDAEARESCPYYQDELQDYGIKITTAKGVIDIVYRNSSNGYYGGSIDYLETAPNTDGWKLITKDWVA